MRPTDKEAPLPVAGTPPLPTPPSPRKAPMALLAGGGLVAALAAAGAVLALTAPQKVAPVVPAVAPVVAAPVPPPPAPRAPHTGPLRICIFPFKSVGESGAPLGDALQEAVTTQLWGDSGVKLVERGSIDLDVGEMDLEAKLADPATRAALGHLTGTELALLGGYQRTGKSLRVFARYIDVETGEVLETFKLDSPEARVIQLEEEVGNRAAQAIPRLQQRLRP